ncbi:MAG TPA: alpha/beta hydrolase [Polyangiales bacterium]|nr:alpha/beta hydrolase [Polyangiales bacterium]
MSLNNRTLIADDGTHIAYGVAGEGPALVLTNGLTTSSFFWKYLLPLWQQRHTVISWDLPGHGGSGPARTPKTARIHSHPRLIAQIMDRLGVQRALQVGFSTGTQVVLETYRQFPGRCAGVALVLGGAGNVLNTTRLPLPGPMIERIVRASPPLVFELIVFTLARAMRMRGGEEAGRKLGLIGANAKPEDMKQVIEHIGEVDAVTLRGMLISLQEHSARSSLAALRVPLLIVAGDKDPFAPSELVGVPLHASAPKSELMRLPEGTHTALLEQPEEIGARILSFASRCFLPI